MKGFQIAAHSSFGKWDQLFGEFLTYPQYAQTYSYYSDLQVSFLLLQTTAQKSETFYLGNASLSIIWSRDLSL